MTTPRCPHRHPKTGEPCFLAEGHDGDHHLPPEHRCHALACPVLVARELLLCKRHWSMVPYEVQREVWRTYRKGQCDDKQPSGAWVVAADLAIVHVAIQEGQVGLLTGHMADIARDLAPTVEEANPLPKDLLL